MASEVDICNAGLIKLGNENVISALGEDGREGETCGLMYPLLRDYLLSIHPWNFAMGRKQLSQDAVSPPFQYNNQFLLPGDYLRALSLFESIEKWAVEDDKLLTNASPANLVYIKRVTDTGKFSAHFTEALSSLMSARMHFTIVGKNPTQVFLVEVERTIKESKRRDSQEGTPETIRADVFTRGIKNPSGRF